MPQYSEPDPATFDAIHALLSRVMQIPAPPAKTVAAWRAYDRALVRSWAERELVRQQFGHKGNPSVTTPFVIRIWIATVQRAAPGL